MKRILPLLLVAGAGIYLLNQFKSFGKTVSVSVGKITFNLKETQRLLYTRIFANVNLIIRNPGNVQGIVKGGKINFIVNDKLVAVVDQINQTSIQAAGETIVPILVGFNTLSIVPTIKDLISLIGKGTAINLKIKGILLTNFGDIDIDQSQSFSI